jgi:uncharacterized protein YecE (DUF72 family)
MPVLIGTAGWSLPRAEQERFPGTGSHLERYAARFPIVEINSSFHRSHRPATWVRWRDAVPETFRFSLKMPKRITHSAGLEGADELVANFMEEVSAFESRIACLLVQLPPKLAFDSAVARSLFEKLAARTSAAIVCEPRHASWFDVAADHLLESCKVVRVATDPARVPAAASPGGWQGVSYYRLHGWPKIYYSSYSAEFIVTLARRVKEDAADRDVWVIFDNTTLGAATRNALDLAEKLNA